MHDPGQQLFSCPSPEELINYSRSISTDLPEELRWKFRDILNEYIENYDVYGAYDRLNNRSLDQIFANYTPKMRDDVVASGEVDGVEYTLYEADDRDDKDS